jgi:hypothetical protein
VPPAITDCRFYHTTELPGLGLQLGAWDLRPQARRDTYNDYFGGHDFTGERVLDVGTASGALAFEIERRGASEVVAFDLDDGLTYECRLPLDDRSMEEFREGLRMIRNGFWLTHHLLGSRVKVAYGHANSLPSQLGRFDTIMLGNILQHLQDPVGAVLQAMRSTDHLLITESDWMPGVVDDDFVGLVMFDVAAPFSWYQVKPGLLQNLLGRWGFTEQRLTWHEQLIVSGPAHDSGHTAWTDIGELVRHFTLSAQRSA